FARKPVTRFWVIRLRAVTSEPAPMIQNMSNPRKASTDIRRCDAEGLGVASSWAGSGAVSVAIRQERRKLYRFWVCRSRPKKSTSQTVADRMRSPGTERHETECLFGVHPLGCQIAPNY